MGGATLKQTPDVMGNKDGRSRGQQLLRKGNTTLKYKASSSIYKPTPRTASVLYKNTFHICGWLESISGTLMYSCVVSLI